jgi:hypothetical protein
MKYYTVSAMQKKKWWFVGSAADRRALLELVERIPNHLPIRLRFGVTNTDFVSSILFDGSMGVRK